ncbi:MAG TPA: adenine phosphoribosyltransferase, partial [Clostridiales bacterium]|nr:adenine phosphoribosyltransferase [Clostridiales bacterium]
GIMFRDITTLIGDGEAYRYVIDQFVEKIKDLEVDVILVLDARGFLVGSPVAYCMGKGVVPIRKAGKLPADTYKVEFDLEYGSDKFEMHKDAIKPGQRVAVLDDLLATGGTANAATKLVEMAGGQVVALGFVIELKGLGGRSLLPGYNVFSLVEY